MRARSQVWDLAAALAAADMPDASSPAQMVVTAHDKDINAVAVSPNDALVVTASQDRTAKVTTMLCIADLCCNHAYG
jgi:U3 small nucleolar RNA-associated protein 13